MRSFLYVYVPGFEYDSKGPLHIDAIRLDVTTGELDKNSDNKITNSLPTYIYLSEIDETKGTPSSLIPGNLVYRAVTSEQPFIDGQYTGQPSKSPFWTDQKDGRVPHGYFYDFITTSELEEKTHHVIGIHNTIHDCKDVYNLKSTEHDGLFVIQIEELNTDLVLNFTFYSRIDSSTITSNEIKVGTPENTSEMTGGSTTVASKDRFFNQEKRTDFFDKYIEIGKWTQTYNPALSGTEEGSLGTGDVIPQFFNLRDWGTDSTEDTNWEIPVNAQILVSDFDAAHTIPITGSKPVLAQYKYNNTTRRHEYDNTLACNTKSYSSNADYYKAFYDGVKNLSSFGYNSDINATRYDSMMRCHVRWVRGSSSVKYYCHEQPVNTFVAYSKQSDSVDYGYIITRTNLTNFNYLYNNLPEVTINNVLRDSTYGGGTEIALIAGINTTGMLQNQYVWTGNQVIDCYNIQKDNWFTDRYQYYYIPGSASLGAETSGKSSLNIAIKQKYPLSESNIPFSNSKVTLYYQAGVNSSYAGNLLQSQFSTYFNNRPNPSYSSEYKGFYIQSIGDSVSSKTNKLTNDSVLESGEHLIKLGAQAQNQISLQITLSNPQVPVMQFGDYNGRDYETTVQSKITDLRQNLTFNSKNFRSANGSMFVGIAQMLYIDLAKSSITYSNRADHQVIPILMNDSTGYNGKTSLPVNISTTNLLDPNPEDTTSYEITRILSNGGLCNMELVRSQSSTSSDTSDRYDSTFCKENRFVGYHYGAGKGLLQTVNFKSTAQTVTLTPGLYVLKLQDSYWDQTGMKTKNGKTNSELKYTIGSTSKTVEGFHNRWAFWVKNSHEIRFDTLYPLEYYQKPGSGGSWRYYNVIGGIGLYQVDLTKTDTNTQTLKQLFEAYRDEQIGDLGFIPTSEEDIYKQIIFPSACCAYEDVKFCAHQSSAGYNSDYANDYKPSSTTKDPVYHHYNFRYLPEQAMYEVVAFYKIPGGSDNKVQANDVIYLDSGLKIPALVGKIVRL